MATELADAVGALEVGEHEDMEQLGAGSGAKRVPALPQLSLELIGAHEGER